MESFFFVNGASYNELGDILNPATDSFVDQSITIRTFPEDGMESSATASWGLDRIDDRSGFDGSYGDGNNGGAGVHVYVLDTGVRTTHTDFGGRAIPTYDSIDAPNVCSPSDTTCAGDGHGHGTHCAGTVAGSLYGVAKGATIHAVKVLSDSGSGSLTGIIMALDWIRQNALRPAVVSMSLGGGGTPQSMRDAIHNVFLANITTVVAAGNSNRDACGYTPAHVPSAITVGASDNNDQRASFSNWGTCLDIYGPGKAITSAWKGGNTDAASKSGTSMACPHVAGGVALLYQQNPTQTPSDIN